MLKLMKVEFGQQQDSNFKNSYQPFERKRHCLSCNCGKPHCPNRVVGLRLRLMRKLSYKIICILLAFTSGVSLTQIKKTLFAANAAAVAAVTDAAPRESQPAPENHPTANNGPE